VGKVAVFPRWKNSDSIRTGDFLYTEWLDESEKVSARMLYDHAKDPDERVNVAEDPDYMSVVEDLSERLEAHRSRME